MMARGSSVPTGIAEDAEVRPPPRFWRNSSSVAGVERARPVEMIVLDANILVRAVLGRRVRQIIEAYAAHGVHFYAPDVAFDDARKYLPPLL